MSSNDTGPLAALRRELGEARRAAGDASADGARLRERLTAMERERDEARYDIDRVRRHICPSAPNAGTETVIEAHCTAVDEARRERDEARAVIAAAWRELRAAGATYRADRALDGAISDALDSEREKCAAAEATLRETTIALERVRGDMRAAEERGVRAGLEAAAAWLVGYGYTHQARDVRALDATSIAARIEAPPVEAAAEPPHRVNDVWRHDGGSEVACTAVAEHFNGPCVWLPVGAGHGAPSVLRERGWRRVRCAPAGGDAVHVDGPGADLEMAGRGAR